MQILRKHLFCPRVRDPLRNHNRFPPGTEKCGGRRPHDDVAGARGPAVCLVLNTGHSGSRDDKPVLVPLRLRPGASADEPRGGAVGATDLATVPGAPASGGVVENAGSDPKGLGCVLGVCLSPWLSPCPLPRGAADAPLYPPRGDARLTSVLCSGGPGPTPNVSPPALQSPRDGIRSPRAGWGWGEPAAAPRCHGPRGPAQNARGQASAGSGAGQTLPRSLPLRPQPAVPTRPATADPKEAPARGERLLAHSWGTGVGGGTGEG